MIKIGDIVLVISQGIGKVVFSDFEKVGIEFDSNEILVFLLKYENTTLFVLEPKIIDSFKDCQNKINFDEGSKQRGSYYLEPGSFDSFSINKEKGEFSARVFGSYAYYVSFNYNTCLFTCTCPVHENCKHEYAFYTYLLKQIDYALNLLEILPNEKIDETSEISDFIDILKDFNKDDLDLYALDKMGECFKNNKPELQRFLNYISKYDFVDNYKLRLAVDMIYSVFDAQHSTIKQFLVFNSRNKNISKMKEELDLIEMNEKTSSRFTYSYTYCLVNSLISKNITLFFDSVGASNNAANDKFLNKNVDAILKYFKKETLSNYFYFEALVTLTNIGTKNFDYHKELIEMFSSLSDDEKKLATPYLPTYVYQMIELHDFAVYFKALPNIIVKCQHFISNISRFTDEEIGYVGGSVADILASPGVSLAENNMLKTVLSRLPYNNILKSYIKNDCPACTIYYELGEVKPKITIDEKAFNYYFKSSYVVNKSPKSGISNISYFLKFFNGTIVAKMELKNSDDNSWTIYDHYDDGFGNYNIVNYFIWNIKNNDEEYKEIVTKINTKKEQIQNIKNDEKLNDVFDKITEDVVSSIRKNNSKSLVKTQYFFDLSEKTISLTMKIGINKYYQLTGVASFLWHINNGEKLTIGKELSFINSEENYDPKDYSVLSILAFYVDKNTSAISRNKMKLSEDFFFILLDKLKGREVFINGISCLLRLDECMPDVIVTKDFKLFLANENLVIFKYKLIDLVLNMKDGMVDILKRNPSYKHLIDIIDPKGSDISRVKKNFINKVYPNFADHIHVDDSIKDEFVISKIEIDSYFDFDDGVVLLETKIKKDDKEIDENEIFDSYDFAKLALYKSLIEEFGFVNKAITEQSDILNFLNADLSEFKKVSNVYLSDKIKQKQVSVFIPPHLKMTFTNNIMKVFASDSEYSDSDLYAILEAIKLKKVFVLLKGDRIIALNEKSKEFFNKVEDLKLNAKTLTVPQEQPIYQSLKAFENIDDFEVDKYLETMVNSIANFKKSKVSVPKINGELKPYQIDGYKWLKTLADYKLGGILADDMGLGKTLEIITLLKSDKANEPILIVAPKSLLYNWKSEFEKFDPGNKVVMIYGLGDYRKEVIENINENERVIYLTSFDSLRNDSKLYNANFNYIILDEAQYIKNIHALKTQNVKTLKATHKFALTGTPIENDIFDLWSIFDFLMPDYLPPIKDFTSSANDEQFQGRIAKYVAPFILRRTKKEVLKELPPKYEHIVTAEMSGEQRKLYDATCLKANEILKDGGKAFDVLYLLTRLRQICVDPHTFVDNYEGESSKTDLMIQIIQEYIANGHKILVFSQFVKALSILEKLFQQLGINYLVLTGETSSEKRLEYVNEFNKNQNIKVFLISLKAGGNGLNLTGADTVIHYDPWWNVAAEDQATDRAYRIGQIKNVEVIKLIMQDSVEQKVIELQNQKKDLIDKLISDDDSSITKVSVDDLKFILN
jgi:SNF2 family DNA or RNA helicase